MLIHSHLAPFVRNVKHFDHLVQKFQTSALRYVKCTIFKKKKKREKDTVALDTLYLAGPQVSLMRVLMLS